MRAAALGLLALAMGCTLPVEPRPACDAWVACVGAMDEAEGTSTDLDRYLADGDCWSGDEIADLCERSCVNGMAWLATREDPTLPEACR